MNRTIRRVFSFVTIASALALVPSGVAFAQDAQPAQAAHKFMHRGGKQGGLVKQALKLESLTPEQRSQIEALKKERFSAGAPQRAANAQLLTVLAQQVESGKVDKAAVDPSLAAEQGAALMAKKADAATLAKLHDILTPAQRNELVDKVEAKQGQIGKRGHKSGFGEGKKLGLSPEQKQQIKDNMVAERSGARPNAPKGAGKAMLESFRGDSFVPAPAGRGGRVGIGEVKRAEAMAPVLTPNQRAQFAQQLRNKAAKLSRS